MSANTRLRLWKETRALLPMWAVVAAWMTAPFILPVSDPLPYAFTGFLFGCVVLGPVCVGHEFTHRTMGVLLAQPISRRQLWWEKLTVTGAALLSLSLLLVVLMQMTRGWDQVIQRAAGDDPWLVALFVMVPVIIPLLGFCSGPTLTLFARNSLGGAALAFILPFFFMVAGIILTKGLGDFDPAVEERLLLSYALLVGAVYSSSMFLHGGRRFEQFEDVNLLAQELAAPPQLTALFSGLTQHLAPARHGLTQNLLRKELRLQRPAFLVAAFLVALWLTFIVVWKVHPPVGAEILIVPSILLALGIPVTVGIVSTAEERNLGVHEWHLTLPVSSRRQWCVKVVVALGVNALLGLLLPGLLAHASSWLANNPQLVAEIPDSNVSPLLIANLVIFCAALYASSAAANSMRALIGTIVIFTAAGLFLPVAEQVHRWLYALIYQRGPMPPDAAYSSWYHFEQFYWPIGWVCLASWVFALGQENFRTSLASLNRPARRLAVLFLAAWLFVNAGLNGPTLLAVFFQRVGW